MKKGSGHEVVATGASEKGGRTPSFLALLLFLRQSWRPQMLLTRSICTTIHIKYMYSIGGFHYHVPPKHVSASIGHRAVSVFS